MLTSEIISICVIAILGLFIGFVIGLCIRVDPTKDAPVHHEFKTEKDRLEWLAKYHSEPFIFISQNLAGQSTGIDRTTYLKLIETAQLIVVDSNEVSYGLYEVCSTFLSAIFQQYTMSPTGGKSDEGKT
jgi:hypothetical protein